MSSVPAQSIALHPVLAEIMAEIPEHINAKGVLGVVTVDGVQVYYFDVGRNASHYFMLGQSMDGSKLYSGSIGEEYALIKDIPEGVNYQIPDDGVHTGDDYLSMDEIMQTRGWPSLNFVLNNPNDPEYTVFGMYRREWEEVFRAEYADTNVVGFSGTHWREIKVEDLSGMYLGHY
jgi:hypothetical protein